MIKGRSLEANDIQTRLFRDELYENREAHTIVAENGRQRYFRSVDDGKDVFVRHGIAINQYRVLNSARTDFVPAPAGKVYTPDTSRPFTENDLLRDATLVENTIQLLQDNVPSSLVGAGGTALAGTALITLTPAGAGVLAAGGAACAKAVAGVKLAGAAAGGAAAVAKGAVIAHPGAAALVGWGTAHEVYLAATDENETLRTKLAGMCDL
jgi:hypothetical protein